MIQHSEILFSEGQLKNFDFTELTAETAHAYHRHFCERLRVPIEGYPTLRPQAGNTAGMKQLLLLHYNRALVEDYCNFIYSLPSLLRKPERGPVGPAQSDADASHADGDHKGCVFLRGGERTSP
jgi:hypothetical protein